MIDWRAHRVWLGLLSVALLIGVAHGPLLSAAQQKQNTELSNLRADYAATSTTLKQLQTDIAETKQIETQIGVDDADKTLAPVDRLHIATQIEQRAAENYLSGFTYTLSPEKEIDVDTVGAGAQKMASTQITMAADVPTDIEAYRFIETLRHDLPGRLTLNHISLERFENQTPPLSATNLHLSVEAEWLSNGANANLAGATK